MSTPVQCCAECGSELLPHVPPGLCPHCALSEVPGTPGNGPGDRRGEAPPIHISAYRSFGDYELLEEIARGGMGIVYKARQVSLDRIVAVKLLLLGQYASEEFIHRFRIEASAAASLQHPNIVAIHEVGVHQGQHYFAMDFVDGPNLAQLVRDQTLPAKRAAGYVKTIAASIHFAHSRRILHRDLKPSNVLIDSNDQPRVTDFGLAKNLANDSDLTLTGKVMGSPSFMPPEQALGERGKMGPASDVYSLGAILYHALTGRPPFVGETLNFTLQQVESNEPVAPRVLVPGIPADLETICLKCLEKEPGARFQSALELEEELGRFLRGEPIESRPVSAPEKLWRWCRRKPAVAGLGAATGLLLLALLIGGPIAFWRISMARERAEQNRERAEQNLYVANVRLASDALTANNLVHARALLNGIADSPQQQRLRGWEWQHLMERCQTENAVVLGRHDAYVAAVDLAPDGQTAASLSGDGMVKVWNLAARKLERSWTAHENPEKGKPTFSSLALVFSPDGNGIATGGRDHVVRIWDASSGRMVAELRGLSNICRGLAFSGDGRILGAIDSSGQACLWALTNGLPTLLHKWEAGSLLAHDIAFSPDLKVLVVSGYAQPTTLWDISNPQQPRLERTLDGTQWTAAFSPDGKWLLAAGSSGHDLRRWAFPDWTEQPRWASRSANLNTLAFSADSRFVASGYANGEITLWDMSGWQPPAPLLGHDDHVTGLTFTRDGGTLISSSRDQTVRLWDLSRKDRFAAMGRGVAALAVGFSADSRYLASVEFVRTGQSGAARTEHSVTLWEVTDAGLRERISKPIGGGAFNSYPSFSPDGTVLAVDDWRNGIQLFAVPSLAPSNTRLSVNRYFQSGFHTTGIVPPGE